MNDEEINLDPENDSTNITKTSVLSDPVTIQIIIESLSERTRLFILKCLHDNPYGLMATDIATKINKKVPTVLYHLDRLREAGVVYEELKPRIEGEKREVKHWLVADSSITLDIDLEIFSYLHRSLDSYILSFLSLLRRDKFIDRESLANVRLEDIMAHQHVNEGFALIIKNNLTIEKVVLLYSELLDAEFTKINDIEKEVKAVVKMNYLREKAIGLLNNSVRKIFGSIDESTINRISDELLKRKVGTAFPFKVFMWEIAERYNLASIIPIRLRIEDLTIKHAISIEIAVQIRNRLLATGNYAVDATERVFLR
ncbi:MAG: ArsR family transcriptional regulator [Candidatus Hermodarchaeota archaeon]